MKTLHIFDWGIIISYIIFLLWIGISRYKKRLQSQNEFILSGRRLSIVGFIATLVTTWYGGILGVGENTLLYGIQTWFIFGLPYYFFAIIYAIWVAPKVQAKKSLSLPDHFHAHFGEISGITSALIITFLASPAPYVLSLGMLLQFLFGLDLGLSLLISTFFSIIYVWNGGFSAVVSTDKLQFFLMFFGFAILLGFLWNINGTPVRMIQSLPTKMLDPLGGNTIQYVLVWFFIAAWTFIDPGFFQRCSAARTPRIAKNGILISILFWAIFDLLTLACGLYAIGNIPTDQALLTYPLLALDILPIGFLGLFLTGIMATIMSTIDSLSLISAITFGRDILWRIEKYPQELDPVFYIKKGLMIISFFAMILAYLLPSVVMLFYTLGSVLIPGLIFPFLYSFNQNLKISDESAIGWMISPIFISGLWFGISMLIGNPLLNIEPFYPGIVVSFMYFLIIRSRTNYGN